MTRPPPAPESIALVARREDRLAKLAARLDDLGARVEILVNAGYGIHATFVESGHERELRSHGGGRMRVCSSSSADWAFRAARTPVVVGPADDRGVSAPAFTEDPPEARANGLPD